MGGLRAEGGGTHAQAHACRIQVTYSRQCSSESIGIGVVALDANGTPTTKQSWMGGDKHSWGIYSAQGWLKHCNNNNDVYAARHRFVKAGFRSQTVGERMFVGVDLGRGSLRIGFVEDPDPCVPESTVGDVLFARQRARRQELELQIQWS